MRATIASLLLLATIYSAHAFGIGKLGLIFGKEGASSRRGTVTPQPTGNLNMVDGTSIVNQVDGTTPICLAGGC
jgi:hypothetical protein